jgi:hypothetical protein
MGSKGFLIAGIWVIIILQARAQLDAGEISALAAFFDEFSTTLTDSDYVFPVWTSDVACACGCMGSLPFDGVECVGGHVETLSLNNIPLSGSIPPELAGLNYLRNLYLHTTGITGTIPDSLGGLANLTSLNLRNNELNLCTSNGNLPDSLTTCDLRNQDPLFCGIACCGCNSNWTSSVCSTNVPACVGCDLPAPHGPVSSCEAGLWYISGPYSGSLTVESRVVLLGDLVISAGQVLIVVGEASFLDVRGTITVTGSIVFYVGEEERLELKNFKGTKGQYAFKEHTFMTATLSSGTKPSPAIVSAHSIRECNRPLATLSGESDEWVVGLRYRNTCNLWWIYLACFGPGAVAIIVFIFVCLYC